jgi:phage protein D
MSALSAPPAAVPIYQGNDFYVPAFEIKIGNRKQGLGVVRDITQVSYKDDIEAIDSFEITINNWDAQQRTFKYSDSNLFDPGQEVELSMGYFGGGRMRLMIRGEITSLRPNFPASGQPTLAISGLNVLHRLRREQKSDVYVKMTDTQIAQRICDRLKVTLLDNPAAGGEAVNEYLIQENKFDILFLLERARRVGYDLAVREDRGQSGIYFGPSGDVRKVTYQLTYGRSLIQFQPTLTTAHQVSKVQVRGWDSKQGKPISVEVSRAELKTDPLARQDAEALAQAFAERQEVVADKPVRDEAEAKQLALATLDRIAKDMVKGSGSVVGLPDLRAGTVVLIDGLGSAAREPGAGRFDGRYFVTSTTHAIGGGGYTTQFECRREEPR